MNIFMDSYVDECFKDSEKRSDDFKMSFDFNIS